MSDSDFSDRPPRPVSVVDKRGRVDDDAAASDAGDESSSSPFPSVVAELEIKLRQAQANFEAFKTQQQKEFDAFRERQQRDTARLAEGRTGDLLKPFLDALDNLERAAQHAEAATAEGLRHILSQLYAALEKAGCVKIEAAPGTPFDPAAMEAVSVQPASSPEQSGTVAAEFSLGFRLGERVLRSARVAVYR